jgi:hypothetical protein
MITADFSQLWLWIGVKLAALGLFVLILYLLGFFHTEELHKLKSFWARTPSSDSNTQVDQPGGVR